VILLPKSRQTQDAVHSSLVTHHRSHQPIHVVIRPNQHIARAARSCDDYLTTFDSDGGSSEGPGYWSYGFGYYTMLAHLVEQRTDGAITFLDEDIVYKAAQYPLRTVLSPT
jgi:hypothetical protein